MGTIRYLSTSLSLCLQFNFQVTVETCLVCMQRLRRRNELQSLVKIYCIRYAASGIDTPLKIALQSQCADSDPADQTCHSIHTGISRCRPHLVEKLDRGLELGHRLLLVFAPPG